MTGGSELLLPEFEPDDVAQAQRMFARSWEFVLGVPRLDILPEADRPEIAFAGRSNVGKSSLINALVRHKGLARTSNTPGRTQELNFFTAPGLDVYLVDMPGYGYAKAPKDKVDAWTTLVRDYLRGRSSLKRVFVLVDARHGLKPEDLKIMDVLDEAAVSYQIVMTKSDKPSFKDLKATLEAVRAGASIRGAAHPVVHLTSSNNGHGLDALQTEIMLLLAQ